MTGILDSLLDARLEESAKTAELSVRHAPIGKGGTNWITRSKPGNTGQLPAYIQNVRNAIMRGGTPESRATAIAIGRVRDWAEGKGNVGPEVKAAAAKAIAEFEAMRGKSKAKSKLSESERRSIVKSALDRLTVCGSLLEADVQMTWSPTLKRVASGSSESTRHEVHDGGQHVGYITERPGYMRSEPKRYRAAAINGETIGDMHSSQADALSSLRRHLEEAPSRVQKHGSKYLVAKPDSYSGPTRYTEYPSYGAARYAAGVPEAPTVPEQNADVKPIIEALAIDAQLVRDLATPGELREGSLPVPLAEAFTERLHPRAHGGAHGGEFVRKLFGSHGAHSSKPESKVKPSGLTGVGVLSHPARKTPIPEGSGPRAPGADLRSPGELAQLARETKGVNRRKLTEKELARSVGPGPWDDKVAETLNELRTHAPIIKDGEQRPYGTDDHYRTAQGTYTPERIELHARIIRALLQGAGAHPNDKQAIFLAGGPASGKSHMLKTGHVKPESDAVEINPDIIKTMLPEYKALTAAKDPRASSLVHEESSHIAKWATNLAMARHHHIVIDGVGNSGPGKFARKVQQAVDHGYKTSVHTATTDTETAWARSEERARKTGRHVPEGYLRQAHAGVSRVFRDDISKMPGIDVHVYDTTGKTKRVYSKSATGAENVRDRKRHAKFLAKANEAKPVT